MTKEKINAAIAEYIEWKGVSPPDFFGDLNSMLIAERVLKADDEHGFACYCIELFEKFGHTVSIFPADRAEMFVKVIDRWQGDESP